MSYFRLKERFDGFPSGRQK